MRAGDTFPGQESKLPAANIYEAGFFMFPLPTESVSTCKSTDDSWKNSHT